MIKDVHERNESVKPHDFELKKLRAALPEYFDKDGHFMLDRLQDTLQDNDVNLTKEGYELKFLGKSYAKYITSTETETVIVPVLKHNAKSENQNSENLYIVGDNLDALKHLLGSYAGKVKCIYIDPPYNTGSDGFVYNDDFGFTPPQLVDKIGISEDEAQRVYDLQGKSSHSAWLTFMYPRLQLAKELLSDDGVIFISIDENEVANLEMACNEIFGEQNNLGKILWKKKTNGNNMGHIAPVHDYILVYGSSQENIELGIKLSLEELSKGYSNPDNDPRGPWSTMDLSANHKGPSFPITNPDTGETFLPPEGRYWVFNEDEVSRRLNDGRIIFGKSGNSRPVQKVFLKERSANKRHIDSWWDSIALNSEATKEQSEIFGEAKLFINPKPVSLLKHIITMAPNEIILDFFSGSASTAHAVMKANAQDSVKRKYIMVQLPEEIDSSKPAYKAGYRTIDEIGRERIKRAAEKIKSETGADIDYGFRLFRLEEPSGQVLNDLEKFDPDQDDALFSGDYVSKFDNLDQQGTPGHDTILTTWLVQDGYGLTADTRQVELSGYSLDVCGDSAYIIEPGLTSDDVRSLVTMVENGKLDISRVVIFGYSVGFSAMHELKKNLSVLKSGKSVTVIERF